MSFIVSLGFIHFYFNIRVLQTSLWTVAQTLRQHWVEIHSKRDNIKSTHLEYAHFVLENVFLDFDLAHQEMTWYLSPRLFSNSIEDHHFVCFRDCPQRYLSAYTFFSFSRVFGALSCKDSSTKNPCKLKGNLGLSHFWSRSQAGVCEIALAI